MSTTDKPQSFRGTVAKRQRLPPRDSSPRNSSPLSRARPSSQPLSIVSTRLNYNTRDIYCHAYRLFPSEGRRWTGRKPGIAIQLPPPSRRERKEREGRKKNFPIQARLPSARINEGGAIRRGRRIIRGPPASGAALADAIARPSLSQPTHNSCPSLLSKSIQLPRGYFSGFGVTRSPIWCSRRESTSIIPITRRTVTLVGIDLRRRNKKERKPWRGRRFSLSLC